MATSIGIRSGWLGSQRLGGLRRFGLAITALNVLGHTLLGFEQAWATPFVALLAAYATEFVLELTEASTQHRPVRFRGGLSALVDFLLPAHISGLAVGMLLYTNARMAPVACAAVIAIASKSLIRVPVGGSSRHVFNPSNFAITVMLLVFPWIGIAPPYQFTENLDRIGDWLLPAIIIASGSILNVRFTRRVPLIAAWLMGFVAQAAVRAALSGAPVLEVLRPALGPMSGVGFLLYTFYMVTDPATTPSNRSAQVAFGASVAATYGVLTTLDVVFGLFFALTIVCGIRAAAMAVTARRQVAVATGASRSTLLAGRNWSGSRGVPMAQQRRSGTRS